MKEFDEPYKLYDLKFSSCKIEPLLPKKIYLERNTISTFL